ncbi:hypothetical protein HC931_03245 [Candidatus Gracilibacteria bacterium]|nr:hypothetical protein [Candidatus Gracilibacteria bacterium]NJM86590.1 hypothetical protein [Hydrococcus sp. RU_2_2]NJP18866.1 hypothetical protein [Hydrococcus sp. CRU_1_1]
MHLTAERLSAVDQCYLRRVMGNVRFLIFISQIVFNRQNSFKTHKLDLLPKFSDRFKCLLTQAIATLI